MPANKSTKTGPALVMIAAFFLSVVETCSSQSLSPQDSPRSTTLSLIAHVDYQGPTAREPMIVEHAGGTLFVSGYSSDTGWTAPQSVPRLWKSSDKGDSWSAVNVGTEADGAIANSDVDLAVSADGTLYFVSMQFDTKAGEGRHIVVGVSRDIGKTWRWTTLSKKRFDDRPWVAVTSDGTAHVIWNDGNGVYHVTSRDRGATWSAAQTIHPQGGSSHLAAGPHGELAVRITPISASGGKYDEGVDLVAVSRDGGTTWQKRQVPGQRDWALAEGATPRWVEPLAWDAKGNLYLLWTQVTGVWLARSTDLGATWSTWRIADNQGDALSYYPYLTARGTGELAATWFSGAGESLHWQVCKIRIGDAGAAPRIMRSALLRTNSWTNEAPGVASVRNAAGEYLTVSFFQDGDVAVVTPIQNKKMEQYGFSFWRFREQSAP